MIVRDRAQRRVIIGREAGKAGQGRLGARDDPLQVRQHLRPDCVPTIAGVLVRGIVDRG
jgi:hypothetical protein